MAKKARKQVSGISREEYGSHFCYDESNAKFTNGEPVGEGHKLYKVEDRWDEGVGDPCLPYTYIEIYY